jgi:CRP-like cAMP-binding protein
MDPLLLLRQIPLFHALNRNDGETLAALLQRRFVRKGDVLFRKGDEGMALYIVLRGKVRISMPTRQGEEITLAVLSDGDFFGEMAILDGLPRSADAAAQEESQLYVLNRKDFIAFLSRNETALRAILQALSLRLRSTDDLIHEICFLPLSARLSRRLLEMSRLRRQGDDSPGEIRITQRELANLLGVTRESINKELRKLRDRGALVTSRNRIFIRDGQKLQVPMRSP